MKRRDEEARTREDERDTISPPRPFAASSLLVIVGPTAVGKTTLSLRVAQDFEGEVISADSRQIYRGLDIGTDKISPQQALR